MKISIKNYQILKQIALEFKPGFTALIGPSNNGKSSILKAIKAATYTEPGNTPIRHGADSYIVGIQNNNHVVMYQKKEGNTKYIVDGQQFSKFGFSTPEEVSNALNMKELQVNGNKIQLNFWDQMDKPFLLDKTPGEMFKFIADSGDNDQLSSVLKSMVSDRQELNREADTLQGSIKSIEDTIKEQENSIEKLKPIIEKADTIIDLKEKYDEYKNISSLIKTYKDSDKLISEIRPKLLSDLHDFDVYNICYYLVKDKIENITKIRELVKQYNSLDLEYHNSLEFKNQIDKKYDILDKLEASKKKDLKILVQDYKLYNDKIEELLEVNEKLQKAIPNESILDKLSTLINIRKLVYNVKAEIEVGIRTQENSIEEINAKELELDEIKRNINVCPLCGQKIGGNINHDFRKDIS